MLQTRSWSHLTLVWYCHCKVGYRFPNLLCITTVCRLAMYHNCVSTCYVSQLCVDLLCITTVCRLAICITTVCRLAICIMTVCRLAICITTLCRFAICIMTVFMKKNGWYVSLHRRMKQLLYWSLYKLNVFSVSIRNTCVASG
jgi:hypothetical protein